MRAGCSSLHRFCCRVTLAGLLLAGVLSVPIPVAAVSAQVELLPNAAYAPALLEGIRQARSRIVASCYLFKIGTGSRNLPREVADALIEARRRGVNVTVHLERPSGERDSLARDNRAAAEYLSRGGVMVIPDSPAVTSHAKAVVIDDRYVYLGSHNLTQSALSRNNELSLRLDAPDLAREILRTLDRL